MQHQPNERGVYVIGPSPNDREQTEVQQTTVSWFRTDDGDVQLTLAGPTGGELAATGRDVFTALLVIREALHDRGWRVLVNAARKEAWGGTPEHPCGLAHVRIYPTLTGPPANDPVDALDMPDDPALVGSGSVIEQMLWHDEWAGTTEPGALTWTDYERRRQESRASR
ncbi:hypothetical protein [Saccharopolyspora gregorii]|uniref:Uncharacterized protein n=1 Tax=Saccharopolyspora gregorii TaxID=33914 RepID=A0ABP6RK48_9PSEU